jgi:uncharacterized phage protein (TIGR01671 family)
MRQLKFRVWNGLEMVYDVTIGKFGVFYVNPMSKGDGLDEKDTASLTPFNTKYADNTPVMQYTGLKDMKGKEMWEGDIVKCYPSGICGIVTYEEKAALFELRVNNVNDTATIYSQQEYGKNINREVIGNIHENPELL